MWATIWHTGTKYIPKRHINDTLGNLSTRRFLRGDGHRKSKLLPIHVSHRQSQPSRLCADFVLPILTSPVKREFCLNDFRAFISFCLQFLYLVILKILFHHFGAFTSDCQVFTRIFERFCLPPEDGYTKKQPVMERTDEHDILPLREMITSELFQFKKGSPDRGKIWESIQERLNKLDHPKFTIKENRGVRDRWNLLQAKFKRIQGEELQSSGIDCVLSEKDALIEES